MMETSHDLDYYIQFFSAIDENKWTTGTFIDDKGNCCGLGHLGEREDAIKREEIMRFREVLELHGSSDYAFTGINDGAYEFLNLGDTPKERVINYLKQLRDGNK